MSGSGFTGGESLVAGWITVTGGGVFICPEALVPKVALWEAAVGVSAGAGTGLASAIRHGGVAAGGEEAGGGRPGGGAKGAGARLVTGCRSGGGATSADTGSENAEARGVVTGVWRPAEGSWAGGAGLAGAEQGAAGWAGGVASEAQAAATASAVGISGCTWAELVESDAASTVLGERRLMRTTG